MDARDGEDIVVERREEPAPVAPCPRCGYAMIAIRGSKDAVCPNCGFKDSCCY